MSSDSHLQTPSTATRGSKTPVSGPDRGGGDVVWAKKGKKQLFFWVTSPKINPARAGWLKRLELILATPWANFDVICDKLWSTITAIFPCVALSYNNRSIFRIIADYWRLQKRSTIWIWVQLLLGIWSFRTPTSIFCTTELYSPGFFSPQPPSHPGETIYKNQTLIVGRESITKNEFSFHLERGCFTVWGGYDE